MPLYDFLTDLTVCLRRLTVVPLPAGADPGGRDLAGAAWGLPIIGALLGGAASVIYVICLLLGLSHGLAAVMAVAALIALTGAAPERALARAAATAFRRGDEDAPSLGEAGTIALVLSLAIRVGALAAIGAPGDVGGALVGAGAIGYAALVAAIHGAPDASAGGMAAEIGRPPVEPVFAAIGIAVVISLIVVPSGWLATAIIVAAAIAGLVWAARRLEPGATGTVTIAAQPAAEALALLVIAAAS